MSDLIREHTEWRDEMIIEVNYCRGEGWSVGLTYADGRPIGEQSGLTRQDAIHYIQLIGGDWRTILKEYKQTGEAVQRFL